VVAFVVGVVANEEVLEGGDDEDLGDETIGVNEAVRVEDKIEEGRLSNTNIGKKDGTKLWTSEEVVSSSVLSLSLSIFLTLLQLTLLVGL